MKRLRRWLFTLSAGISLLLCIPWLGVWSSQLLPLRG
jgi:hypothetical protein